MKNKLTQHQRNAFEAIVSDIKENLFSFYQSSNIEDRLLSLTGPAGTGKSFLTAQISKAISRASRELNYFHNDGICITASTHKAVKVLKEMVSAYGLNVECRTIHSFLGIKPIYDYDIGEEKFTVDRSVKNPPKASLLIIDESSMISKELYNFITEAVSRGRVNTVLFIGDPFQLLPVGNSGENPIYKLIKQFQLKEIVRQAKDSNIIKLATEFRNRIESQDFINIQDIITGDFGEEVKLFTIKEKFIKSFYKNKDWYKEDKILASFTNKDVDTFNALVRNQFWKERGVSNPSHFLPNDMLRFKSALIVEGSSQFSNSTLFQNGEEVLLYKAEFIDHQKSNLKFWKCTVVGRNEKDFFRVIDPDSIAIYNDKLALCIHLAKTASYTYARGYWKDYFQLKSAFADVQYIFASTIHKLQGSTYDTAYIDLASLINNKQISDDMKYRLAYVAITRAKNNIKIFY